MNRNGRIKFFAGLCVAAVATTTAFAQLKRPSKKPVNANTVLFAVLEDGKRAEPIGLIRNGKFVEGDGVDPKAYNAFMTPAKSYSLVFGGSPDGSVKVNKKLTGECAGSSAEIVSSPVKARLKRFCDGGRD